MSSSLLFQQCPECLVRFTRTVAVLWLVASRICSKQHVVFFSKHFVSVHVMHPYSSINTTRAWKKSCFVFLVFHMVNKPSVPFHACATRMLTSLSGNEILQSKYVNLSTNFREDVLVRIHELYFICIHVEAN